MRKKQELNEPKSCLSRAREDEMLFVLLGRDAAAPATIRFWMEERIRLGKNTGEDEQITEAAMCATQMEMDWATPLLAKKKGAPVHILAALAIMVAIPLAVWFAKKQFTVRGAVIATQCSVPAREKEKEAVEHRRVIKDMAVGESACGVTVAVDSERRAYLFGDEPLATFNPGTQACRLNVVKRERDGFWLSCGAQTLTPSDYTYAGHSWAIPVKGFR
jgi:hypothetical protein